MNNVKNALKVLIKGETDAVNLYKQFADKAKAEGYDNISILFDALIMAERIHIKNHLNALGESFIPEKTGEIVIGSTLDNLFIAITGEVEENKKLYPRLIKSIKTDCKSIYGKVARLSMIWARDVEMEHANLLKLAYKALNKGKDLKFHTISICQVCGNIVVNKIPSNECSVCGHDTIFFKSILKDK